MRARRDAGANTPQARFQICPFAASQTCASLTKGHPDTPGGKDDPLHFKHLRAPELWPPQHQTAPKGRSHKSWFTAFAKAAE